MDFNSLYRDYDSPVIVCHHRKEDSFITVPHLHSQYEIYYNISGGRSFFINNSFYLCEPHSVFLIPNTHIHKVTTDKNAPYERCIINIDKEITDKIATLPNMKNLGIDFLYAPENGGTHKILLTETEHNTFLKLIDSYIETSESELSKLIKLLEILKFIEKRYNPDKKSETSAPIVFSDKVIATIEENPTNQYSLNKIASMLYVSENYLCTKFKAETGITVNNYLVLRKFAEAKKLLHQGYSVKEACFNAGFSNYASFIRTFKEKEGISPGKLKSLSPPL